ncbi:MAG: hypothetical protein CO187_04620 [Zetaproteobacteria bacterium CG_4_9_14_3_um_filter_53_7]|nr:MAG: hypothetical protein CO187_04620 [Zetaproteobacteria bacterium CG_4_9_14_3_um_filter_53_7]
MSHEQTEDEGYIGCIVGAVVQLKPDTATETGQQLAACAGVEIHGEDEQSRLVITMEAATSKAALKLTEQIQNMDGVLSVTPVYQHCEENQQQDQQGGWKWR